jgi:hypothetical protein
VTPGHITRKETLKPSEPGQYLDFWPSAGGVAASPSVRAQPVAVMVPLPSTVSPSYSTAA